MPRLLQFIGMKGRRGAVAERRAPAARVVARARPLDLDDVGAHVAEDLAAERAGEVLTELDDGDAVQGKSHEHLQSRPTLGTGEREGVKRETRR